MSAASRGDRLRRLAGYTFIEVMLSVILFTSLGLVVERTLNVAHRGERFLNAVNRTTRRGQDLGYELFDTVNASRKMFQNDAIGQAYLAALDTTWAPIAPDCRLPSFDTEGILKPDEPGDPHTGNILLFVRESDPAPCVADPLAGKERFIDTYRFVCIYPYLTDRQVISDDQNARDLCVWRSEIFPSRPQILAIEDDDERLNVIADLYHRFGYVTCWDPNEPQDLSFYGLYSSGAMAVTPYDPYTISEDYDVSDGGRLVHSNIQLARTDAGSYDRRAVLTRDSPASWVPDGFEVKVVGPSGSRKVWMNVVIEAQSARGAVAVHTGTLIASTRDL